MAGRTDPQPAIVFLHAHPDDEAILTGATLAKASAAGLRTVVLYATRGDAGETTADLGGESLGERRAREAVAACNGLGVSRVEWLGYADSGMAGTATNADAAAFCNAIVATVAAEVLTLLGEERIVAVVGYDGNGTYGHPDHLQVHRLARALAASGRAGRLIEATYNREYLATLPDSDGTVNPAFAASEADLTHFVQGDAWFRAKMEAVKCHWSQAPANRRSGTRRSIQSWRARFGTEWFIVEDGTRGLPEPLGGLFEPKHLWTGPLRHG